ncbi:hypothetical protein N7470_000937 [Penicillium chermesinum]|nr:hypothetical protein N7470_000937 [Penicillium chermesinum]
MATAEVIVLSSSPITPARSSFQTSLDSEKQPKAPPRDPAPPPLPTAAELFRPATTSRFFADSYTTERDNKGKGTKKTASQSKSDGKKAPGKSRQKAEKSTKPEALEVLEPETIDSRDNAAKKKTTQKSRARKTPKSKEAGNMKLNGKVTKASSNGETKNPKQAAENSVSTSQQTSNLDVPAQLHPQEKNEDLQLDEAIRRRRDWTPPTETAPQDGVVENSENAPRGGAGGLGKLLSEYHYSGVTPHPREILQNLEGGPTKRRKIELVDSAIQAMHFERSISKEVSAAQSEDSSSSGAPTKKKPKAPKKPTTVTARMTAQYTSKGAVDDALIKELLPEITKAKSSRSKTKSLDKDPVFNVVSPELAAKTLDAQDLIFGTCSQLEREDSPQALREMQEAIRASESISTAFSVDAGKTTDREKSSARLGSRLAGTKNLMGFQAEKVDTVDLRSRTQASKRVRMIDPFQDDEWLEPDHKPSTSALRDNEALDDTKPNTTTERKLSSDSAPMLPIKSKTVHITSEPLASKRPAMPQYTGFTDAELSKQVSAYGFKSVRGRKKMIELLQKCWESKHGKAEKFVEIHVLPESSIAATTVPEPSIPGVIPNAKGKGKLKANESISALMSPSRKIGRTHNPSTSSFNEVEEIQDSEEEITPSPSRVQKHYTEMRIDSKSVPELSFEVSASAPPKSPCRRKTIASKGSHAAKSKPSSSQRSSTPDIGAQMTKAIRAQPLPSIGNHRSHPTWYQKILMYDPIILEDFATWLNVEGFALIGEDREVGPLDVRQWCESKGICCCWKQGSW